MNKFEKFHLSKLDNSKNLIGGASEIVAESKGTESERTITVVCDLEGLNNSKTYGDWNDEGC